LRRCLIFCIPSRLFEQFGLLKGGIDLPALTISERHRITVEVATLTIFSLNDRNSFILLV
jgi:hypothetical protein